MSGGRRHSGCGMGSTDGTGGIRFRKARFGFS